MQWYFKTSIDPWRKKRREKSVWNQERIHFWLCVCAFSVWLRRSVAWAHVRERGAHAQWRTSAVRCREECAASLSQRQQEEEREEKTLWTAHGRTLTSIMAPIGLKAVVGESKIIMLILLGYWGLMFNHVNVLFYGTFPLHVISVPQRSVPLDADGCFPAIVLNGEDITLGMLQIRIVHQWSMTWIGFIPITCCLNYKYVARELD